MMRRVVLLPKSLTLLADHALGYSRQVGAARLRSRARFEAGGEKFGMPMDARDIESMIKAAIPDADVTIRDLAGDGDHYAATVISESFRGKSRVQQHQIVYQSLKGQMGGVLHALALQTGVPER